MSHYTWHNVTESSRVTTKYVLSPKFVLCTIGTHSCSLFSFRRIWVSCTISDVSVLFINYCRHAFATLSFVAEIFIFLYVGMDALDIDKWRFISDR